MNSPLISVVLPTYNRAHTLQKAIKCVLDQTYSNWELIIVDDGSIDNTSEIVKAYKDSRIRYFKTQNGGSAKARNYGVEQANGKWILYLDSDDELLPKCVETMLRWIDANPEAVFALTRSKRTLELYENGKLIKSVDDSGDTPLKFTIEDIFNRKARHCTTGIMHLRSIFDGDIRWDPDCKLMEDWELLLTIGNKYPKGFVYVPVVLQRYSQRFGSDNIVSATTYSDWADILETIYQKHKNDQLMANQTWYPSKVNKWNKRQAEYEAGKRPPYHLHYFQK